MCPPRLGPGAVTPARLLLEPTVSPRTGLSLRFPHRDKPNPCEAAQGRGPDETGGKGGPRGRGPSAERLSKGPRPRCQHALPLSVPMGWRRRSEGWCRGPVLFRGRPVCQTGGRAEARAACGLGRRGSEQGLTWSYPSLPRALTVGSCPGSRPPWSRVVNGSAESKYSRPSDSRE